MDQPSDKDWQSEKEKPSDDDKDQRSDDAKDQQRRVDLQTSICVHLCRILTWLWLLVLAGLAIGLIQLESVNVNTST